MRCGRTCSLRITSLTPENKSRTTRCEAVKGKHSASGAVDPESVLFRAQAKRPTCLLPGHVMQADVMAGWPAFCIQKRELRGSDGPTASQESRRLDRRSCIRTCEVWLKFNSRSLKPERCPYLLVRDVSLLESAMIAIVPRENESDRIRRRMLLAVAAAYALLASNLRKFCL